MKFNIKIEKLSHHDIYAATCPEIKGLVVEADTIEEVKLRFKDALNGIVNSYHEHFESLPGIKNDTA